MGDLTLPGNPPIPVILRRSARARRLSLRLSQLDGRVTLTLPQRLPQAQALAFLHEKEGWLRSNLAQQAEIVPVGRGAMVPVEGNVRQIQCVPGRGIRLEPGAILVPGDPARVAPRLLGHFKALARDRLAQASDAYATELGRPYTRLTLRDTRSRWGSCTSDGGLMYSWRLILAPPEVLRYVAAHEVAHLAEMNHSPAFWAVVTQLYGNWKTPRLWLRNHGADLHRYRFGN
ncbi:M48 family metallopeptidase [Puniceibacterium sp. IMCC21224]|uniref:M48 family metallopeptidase n=1 Tax=Puniceibacterium sp. IMCC21224 TaxID=1618204 RepID=UPI00064DF452|nr:SprT family zinc-dependent metalloprotease [Puniceibacterium sp. IMCC21224]KMK66285.1 putative metal-dependent hydrolase [Puniceibacterium sp. IMCC21224]